MNRIGIRADERTGAALVTTLAIAFSLCAVVGVMVSAGFHVSKMANKLGDRLRAQSIAEAGACHAYSVLATNFDARDSDAAFPSTSFAGGTYDATVAAVGSDQAVITSDGIYNGVTETVMLDVKRFGGGGSSGPAGAFQYAIVSGDDMTFTGTSPINVGGGAVHAGGNFKMTGSCSLIGNLESCVEIWTTGTTVLDGDTWAPDYKGKSPGNVSGTAHTSAVDPVSIPEIDLTPYYNWALAHGEVYNGNQHFSSGDVSPNGGVMWVNGNLKISTSGTMTGCFIATGDIKVSGSGDQVKVNDFPAFVSRDGDIDISGSGDYHGLIYAKTGDFDKSGSGEVIGSIVCAGEFDKSGSWSLMTYEDSTPIPPGASGGEVTVGVTAWQR
ncbi:MAG: hypothetical protein JW951_09285 [Lentisphaerae bacterium]|nr:hypothetical protein [Lentisphaerota bacterium]